MHIYICMYAYLIDLCMQGNILTARQSSKTRLSRPKGCQSLRYMRLKRGRGFCVHLPTFFGRFTRHLSLPLGLLRVSALTEPFEDKLTRFSRTLPKGATTAYPWLKQTVPSRVRDNYNKKRRMRVQGWIMINNFLTWWISTVPMSFWWGEKVWGSDGMRVFVGFLMVD